MSQDNETTTVGQLIAPYPAPGPTLLPGPVASLVSLLSKSTTVSIRLGSLIGGTALDAARIGTLTGLELGRAAVEGILVRAGRDVNSRRAAGGGEEDGDVERWTKRGVSGQARKSSPEPFPDLLNLDKLAAFISIAHTATPLDWFRDIINHACDPLRVCRNIRLNPRLHLRIHGIITCHLRNRNAYSQGIRREH